MSKRQPNDYIKRRDVIRTMHKAHPQWGDSNYNFIREIPSADVIERTKIDKALKEMDDLASHKVHPISFDQSVAIDMCIDILKRNIGE